MGLSEILYGRLQACREAPRAEHASQHRRAAEGQRDARDRADVRGHDLRRTAASLMASGGVPRFVISRILNHSEEKDITSVYDRYSYDAEKRAAMEFWNRQLTAILKGKSASTIRRFAS